MNYGCALGTWHLVLVNVYLVLGTFVLVYLCTWYLMMDGGYLVLIQICSGGLLWLNLFAGNEMKHQYVTEQMDSVLAKLDVSI